MSGDGEQADQDQDKDKAGDRMDAVSHEGGKGTA